MIKFHQQSGFSLVETLVAISLLLIMIVGPMAISAKTAKSTSFASEQVQAFFLAQEGLELAQKARDDYQLRMFLDTASPNYLADPWSDFTDDTAGAFRNCFKSTGCGLWWADGAGSDGKLKTFAGTLGKDCPFPASCKLYINSADVRNKFNNTTSTAGVANEVTPFSRVIHFSSDPADMGREIKVTSTVTWRTGSLVADQKVELSTYLFNTNYEAN